MIRLQFPRVFASHRSDVLHVSASHFESAPWGNNHDNHSHTTYDT